MDDVYVYKKNLHRPQHMTMPDSFYFLTAHTYNNGNHFSDDIRMTALYDVIAHAQQLYNAKNIWIYIVAQSLSYDCATSRCAYRQICKQYLFI